MGERQRTSEGCGERLGRGTEKRNESHVGFRRKDREVFKGVIRRRRSGVRERENNVG